MHDTQAEETVPRLALPPAPFETPALAEALPELPPDAAPLPVLGKVAWWPFVLYGTGWAALSAVTGVLLYRGLPDTAPIDQAAYPYLVVAGMSLAITGPAVGLATWLLGRRRVGSDERDGMLSRALLRAGVFALAGTTLWWVVLTAVDAYRLGLLPWPR